MDMGVGLFFHLRSCWLLMFPAQYQNGLCLFICTILRFFFLPPFQIAKLQRPAVLCVDVATKRQAAARKSRLYFPLEESH